MGFDRSYFAQASAKNHGIFPTQSAEPSGSVSSETSRIRRLTTVAKVRALYEWRVIRTEPSFHSDLERGGSNGDGSRFRKAT
jgi:hypothetical protein